MANRSFLYFQHYKYRNADVRSGWSYHARLHSGRVLAGEQQLRSATVCKCHKQRVTSCSPSLWRGPSIGVGCDTINYITVRSENQIVRDLIFHQKDGFCGNFDEVPGSMITSYTRRGAWWGAYRYVPVCLA